MKTLTKLLERERYENDLSDKIDISDPQGIVDVLDSLLEKMKKIEKNFPNEKEMWDTIFERLYVFSDMVQNLVNSEKYKFFK